MNFCKRWTRWLITFAMFGLMHACGGGGGGSGDTASLVAIEVTPGSGGGAAGTTTQFEATGIYSDGSHNEITAQVSWASSNTAVTTISGGGLATALTPGSATLSASLQGVAGSASFNVTGAYLVSLEVSRTTASVAKGMSAQFTAMGVFSDKSTQNLTTQVTWSSSNTAAAAISATGLATGVGVGSSTISATSGGSVGAASFAVTPAILVSISLSPVAPSIPKGVITQFTASGVFSDNSTQNLTSQAAWSSNNSAAATVGTTGLATAVAVGNATIAASVGGISGSTPVTVTPAALVSIQVTPPTASIAKGLTQQFTATGIYTDSSAQNLTAMVTWSASSTTIATISNATGSSGLATAVGVGPTGINAVLGGVTGTAAMTVTPAVLVSIQVTPVNPSVPKGLTVQLTANGIYTDQSMQNLTTLATWSPADPTVATVSNAPGQKGLATAVGASTTSVTTTLTATYAGISGGTNLTVAPAILTSLTVTPTSASIPDGMTQQYSATGGYSDGSTRTLTTTVSWLTADPTVATFSTTGPPGVATAFLTGTATTTTITAALSGVTSTPVTLTVTPAVIESLSIMPLNPTIPNGTSQQFTATGTYSDHSTRPVTSNVSWISSDLTVATFDPSHPGLATAFLTGTSTASTITASLNGVVSNATTLTVSAAVVNSIAVTPTSASVPNGKTQQYTAMGTFSNMTTADITNEVTWISSDTTVATFSTTGTPGLATTLLTGTATMTNVTASYEGVTSSPSATLTVTPAELVSISVSPSTPTIVGVGFTQQFAAQGHYTNNTSKDITQSVTWSSADTTVASISAGGLVTSVGTSPLDSSSAPISTTITAAGTSSSGPVSGTASVTVDASYNSGNNTVYDLLSTSFSLSLNGMTGSYSCSGCHTTTDTPKFYVAADPATTLTNIQTYGLSGFYAAPCESPTPAGMPSYAGTSLCTVLQEWIAEGATN